MLRATVPARTDVAIEQPVRFAWNPDKVVMFDKDRLEQHGLKFSGLSPDGILPEIVEYEDHPWFIGVQFHPELKSRPFEPHPLFASFIQAAMVQSRLV